MTHPLVKAGVIEVGGIWLRGNSAGPKYFQEAALIRAGVIGAGVKLRPAELRLIRYSRLSNKRAGGNKRAGVKLFLKLISVPDQISVPAGTHIEN